MSPHSSLLAGLVGCSYRHGASQAGVAVTTGHTDPARPPAGPKEAPAVSPRDWLLLLFHGADEPIDRVRVQKALFLFSRRSNAPADQKYEFRPYKYGPFSFEIYPDLDVLVGEGTLKEDRVPWMTSPVYSLTAVGRSRADELRAAAPGNRLALLDGVRRYVLQHDFATLLNEVYRLYPEFATRSVFR